MKALWLVGARGVYGGIADAPTGAGEKKGGSSEVADSLATSGRWGCVGMEEGRLCTDDSCSSRARVTCDGARQVVGVALRPEVRGSRNSVAAKGCR